MFALIDPEADTGDDHVVMGPRNDAPRTNRDPAEIERKNTLLEMPHASPLVAHVERIRSERGADRVPDFDPTEAGVSASILLLLEAPGPKATRERGGSGFISPDNDDGSAENMWNLLREAGVDRGREVVTWNVVPWYVGSDRKIRAVDSDDLIEGRRYIEELVTLLPALRVVVLLGKPAARGWTRLGIDAPAIEAPHPSPRNLNTRPESRAAILDALREARRVAGYSDGPSPAPPEVQAADVVGDAMQALSRKRPIFHSEADFQHALAWEIHRAHPTARIRLEQRVAVSPSVELDVLVTLDGKTLGVELKYPRRGMTAEVDGELFALATGADDHGRVYAIEDFARLERLVAAGVIDSGVFVLLTNVANIWLPSSGRRPVLYDAFRIHDGHALSGTMAWGEWGRPGGRPAGTGVVTLVGTYPLTWRDYSNVDGAELRYLLVGIDPKTPRALAPTPATNPG